MNANENKKPIGFDMELTDEQLKNAAGGAGGIYQATYQCPNCKSQFLLAFTAKPPDTIDCRICINTKCSLISVC